MSRVIDRVTIVDRSIARGIDRLNGIPKCPACSWTMRWYASRVYNSSNKQTFAQVLGSLSVKGKMQPQHGTTIIHDNQVWLCPNCLQYVIYRIPITNAQYKKEVIEREGRVIMFQPYRTRRDEDEAFMMTGGKILGERV